MQGRKIVFRVPTAHGGNKQTTNAPEESTAKADQTSAPAKPTAAYKRPRSDHHQSQEHTSDVIFCLKRHRDAPRTPAVAKSSTFVEGQLQEAGQLRLKWMPERFQATETVEGKPLGDVYSLVSETRSTPGTPLMKTKSLDKTPKHEGDEKAKHDEFDEALDSLLSLAVELKQMTKNFLPERDSARTEKKLQEYLVMLRRLEDMTKNAPSSESERGKRDQLEVPMDLWKAIDAGVHPDTYLLEQSEKLTTEAQHNIRNANIVEKFLETGHKLSKPNKADNG